jgi:hypothetical protein
MPILSDLDPNDYAPASGRYELLNVFGTETGESVSVAEGDQLPATPIGFSWQLVALDEFWDPARGDDPERFDRDDLARTALALLRAFQESLRVARHHAKHGQELSV